MLGFGYLLLFGLYFLLARAAVRAMGKWAKNRNKSVNLWRTLVGIGMLSIVFWDVIPVYGLYSYQCATEGGFTVYKTIDEWKKENPGIAETLTPFNGRSSKDGNTTRYLLNQRFAWDRTISKQWYIVHKKDEKIIDFKTGEVLAEYIDFYTNLKNPVVTQKVKLRDFKMWMKIDSCETVGKRKNQINFNGYYSNTKKIGSDK